MCESRIASKIEFNDYVGFATLLRYSHLDR